MIALLLIIENQNFNSEIIGWEDRFSIASIPSIVKIAAIASKPIPMPPVLLTSLTFMFPIIG